MNYNEKSDVTNPELISILPTHPPFGGGAGGATIHTIVPYTDRQLAVFTTEGERPFTLDPNRGGPFEPAIGHVGIKGAQQPLNVVGITSIQDPANPVLISTIPKPVPPPGSI
ncbi:hypothetical protein, partial [Acetobacter sp. DmW_125123]